MKKDFLKAILVIIGFAFCSYCIHFFVFAFFELNTTARNFRYSLLFLYVFFTIFSAAILIILSIVKKKNFDVVGMSFMVLTSSKILFCYILIRPIIATQSELASIEKMNFFGIFALFLAMDTVIATQILNNKQS